MGTAASHNPTAIKQYPTAEESGPPPDRDALLRGAVPHHIGRRGPHISKDGEMDWTAVDDLNVPPARTAYPAPRPEQQRIAYPRAPKRGLVTRAAEKPMPKRSKTGDSESWDAPEVIASRRKARVSPRFRQQAAGAQAKSPAPAPSPFASIGGTAPKTTPGFVFGGGSTGQLPKSSFSLGVVATPASGASLGTEPATGGTSLSVPESGVRPTPSTRSSVSFPTSPPDPPADFPKPPQKQLTPAGPAAVKSQPLGGSAPLVSSPSTGRVFGDGTTAARGSRLNKRFSSWVSHQLAEDASSFLDSGLRDYVAYAAEIRERVDLAKVEPSPTPAFRHPTGSTVAIPEPNTDPKTSETSASTTAQPSVAALPPPVVSAPTSAPVAKSAPSFSFSVPSSLPAAPSGPRFPFSHSSGPASASNSGGSKTATPPAPSPSKGFKFDGGGLGAVGASGGVFKGFQVPAGVAAPPAVVAGSVAVGAEEDGMPKEDPSKLERAPGEENEEIMGQFRAKLFRFKADEKAWGDMGVGMLRLMKHTANDARRLVLRNDMGKVILNAAVYKGMSVTKAKNAIKFMAKVSGDGPTAFMVRVTATEIDDLYSRVVALVPSS